jgi:leucyl/phenylalanyl-tRNA--protein transferase
MDQAFREVIAACAAPRPGSFGTWITQDMADAYNALHETGCAHSVECWLDDRLVGGLYGVSTGRVFFGESMFSRVPDASKVAFAWLVRQLRAWEIGLVDCQVYSAHLASLGAEQIPRADFVKYLDVLCENEHSIQQWDFQAAVRNEPW